MSDLLEDSVQQYCVMAKAVSAEPNLSNVDTPFIDTGSLDPDGDAPIGHLSSAAASILKVLYAARMARFDLLKPITMLASRIS